MRPKVLESWISSSRLRAWGDTHDGKCIALLLALPGCASLPDGEAPILPMTVSIGLGSNW